MSHFKVLVIGDNWEEQLAPFDENLQVEPYKEHVSNEDFGRFVEFYSNPTPKKSYEIDGIQAAKTAGFYPVRDAIARDAWVALGENWNGCRNGWDEKGPFRWSTYNPKSQWDWYVVGGRYCGSLLAKQGAAAKVGEPGIFDNARRHPGGVDQVRVRNIDWAEMRRRQRLLAEEAIAALRRQFEAKDQMRNFEWDMSDKEIVATLADPEQWINTNSASFTCFAVVKDGEWFERGRMGWWGMVANEKSDVEWQQKVSELLANLDDDALLTVVDCHI